MPDPQPRGTPPEPPSSGGIALPALVERLQNHGEKAVAEFSEAELAAIVDDLTLALESEAIRDHLSRIVARIEGQKHRTFRRIVEIARQDDERTPILLAALKFLGFSGEPTDEEFAWLVHVMSTNPNAMARLDAFDQALRLALQPALQAILEAVAAIHPDEAIRAQMSSSQGEARVGGAVAPDPTLMTAADLGGGLDLGASFAEEEEPTIPLGVEPTPPPQKDLPPIPTDEPSWNGQASLSETEPAAPSITASGKAASIAPVALDGLPDAAPEAAKRDRVTVRTLLAEVSHATDGPAPALTPSEVGPVPAPADNTAAEATPVTPFEGEMLNDESGTNGETVETMLRSLETVKLSLRDLETSKGVLPTPAALGPDRTAPPVPAPEKSLPGWMLVDLKPLTPPDRARALAKVRRELKASEQRSFLSWLFEQEGDLVIGAASRREILEFAFDRPHFYSFDSGTRTKLGRWIRERAAADALTPSAILGALRRVAWVDGEPPRIDEETRPIVDAASGVLGRVPSEERVALLSRDFTAWLFAIREFEDTEVLHRWAQDEYPGVAEGLFRALAAMDASASKLGVTEGPTALELALGAWDGAHNEQRLSMAQAIAGGWSRGFVLNRARFFEAFWKRYQENENQRQPILIALASFEKEIEAARAKEAPAPPPMANGSEVTVLEGASSEADGAAGMEAIAEGPADETLAESFDAGIETTDGKPSFLPPPTDAIGELHSQPAPVLPESQPVAEDSAPSEAKVLASLVRKKPAPVSAASTSSTAAPTSAGIVPAGHDEEEVTQPEDDGGSMDRYFDQKRRELERVMRRVSGGPEEGGPSAVPQQPPSELPTDPRIDAIPEEGEAAGEDYIPDEGDAVLTEEEKASSGPKKLPTPKPLPAGAPPSLAGVTGPLGAPPVKRPVMPQATPIAIRTNQPPRTPTPAIPPVAAASEAVLASPPRAAGTPDAPPRPGMPPRPAVPQPSRPGGPPPRPASPVAVPTASDSDVVLPGEPLRTLADYTGFLRALSGGTSIDELLGRHGMDYRQYASCMTSWGKLLQNRPDLALRMGQLLRGG